MAEAEDLDRFARTLADNRDLNYNNGLVEGEAKIGAFLGTGSGTQICKIRVRPAKSS
jgi:hypothetical protein